MPVNTSERFEAILRRPDGEILANGYAKVHLARKSVTFESDFVPLYPLGTAMEIVRLFHGQEVHLFKGNVYLSDKRLMRIVSVDDELLPGSDSLYCHNMPFSAAFAVIPPKRSELKLMERIRTKQPEQRQVFKAPILEISPEKMTFQYDIETPFEEGQKLLMAAYMPLQMPRTIIQVLKPMCFGLKATYECEFIRLTPADRENLQCFLQQYHLKKHKLF